MNCLESKRRYLSVLPLMDTKHVSTYLSLLGGFCFNMTILSKIEWTISRCTKSHTRIHIGIHMIFCFRSETSPKHERCGLLRRECRQPTFRSDVLHEMHLNHITIQIFLLATSQFNIGLLRFILLLKFNSQLCPLRLANQTITSTY